MSKEEQDVIDYEKLWLQEKLSRLQTEANLLQMKFTQVQEQIQIVGLKIKELEEDKGLQPE